MHHNRTHCPCHPAVKANPSKSAPSCVYQLLAQIVLADFFLFNNHENYPSDISQDLPCFENTSSVENNIDVSIREKHNRDTNWHISRFKNNNTSIKKLNALKGTNMVWFWKQWKISPKLYPTNFCPTKWNHQHDWVGIIQSWLKWTHVYIWQQFQTCTSSSCNFNVKVWRCMCYIFGKFSFIFGSQELFLFVRILIPKSKFSYMTCWLEHTT